MKWTITPTCACHDPVVFGHTCTRQTLTVKTWDFQAISEVTQLINETGWNWR